MKRVILPAIALALAACGGGDKITAIVPPPVVPPSTDTIPLRTLALARGIRFGSALDAGFNYTGTAGTTYRAKFAREFNILTPGNVLKHQTVHPSQFTYNYVPGDAMLAFAQANNMQMRGHTLVWHSQLSSWLTSGTWTAAQAATLMTDHIANVVGHYKGQLAAWDVVNEALNDDGTYRSGFYYDHIGPSYIETAFRAAHTADSTVLLFYNDYNIEGLGTKSDSVYAMIQRLLNAGVPIHGIGLQGHFIVGGTSLASMNANIARFAALGLKVQFTEVDVRIPLPASDAQLATQAQDYANVVSACIGNIACTAVIPWGMIDSESWILTTFPGFGAPLLFTSGYLPKPAFTSVYNLLK